MPAPGRPREFKYQLRKELIQHVNEGATVEEAAQIVGVSLRTVQREAKGNECFDHDLQLALHHAPVDPYQQVARAARTHWRAAAWLLERTDPDRYAKRPPGSCSPETLRDVCDWLIETALEATPPEHREAVYCRMCSVADKALDVLMPDQHKACRLAQALPERPMPLSDHEWLKTLQVVGDGPAPAAGLPSEPPGGAPSLPAARTSQLATRSPETPVERDQQAPPGGTTPAPQATAGRAAAAPPNGGIMSPKMSAATECRATQLPSAEVPPRPAPDSGLVPISRRAPPLPHRVDARAQSCG